MASTEAVFVRKNLTVSHSERATLLSRIKTDCRRYARTAADYRRQTVHFGNESGVCFVAIGETRIYARTTITSRPPDVARPKRGFVQFEINFDRNSERLLLEDLSLSDIRQAMRRALGSIVGSQAIDTDTLCISAGKLVWHVLTQLNVLNYDGNVTDAALLAAMGALVHARHPMAKVGSNGKVRVLSEREHPLVRLHIFHIPVSSTYSLFLNNTAAATSKVSSSDHALHAQNELLVAVDADARETLVSDGSITIITNKYGQVCSMFTMGCATLVAQDEFLEKLCRASSKRAVLMHDLLRGKADASHERLSKWRIDFYKDINKTMLPDELESIDDADVDKNAADDIAVKNRTESNLPYSIAGPRSLLLSLIGGGGTANNAENDRNSRKPEDNAEQQPVMQKPQNFWHLDAMPTSVTVDAEFTAGETDDNSSRHLLTAMESAVNEQDNMGEDGQDDEMDTSSSTDDGTSSSNEDKDDDAA